MCLKERLITIKSSVYRFILKRYSPKMYVISIKESPPGFKGGFLYREQWQRSAWTDVNYNVIQYLTILRNFSSYSCSIAHFSSVQCFVHFNHTYMSYKQKQRIQPFQPRNKCSSSEWSVCSRQRSLSELLEKFDKLVQLFFDCFPFT